ncbi:hypothetical protein BaRGS_00039633 [Batillaria attramentaria]|uniref:RFX-type winged-helix domain-containing protein n=1 Tax=Batillaria attramentaria TaxID=370345 RepID=A0ABD0J2F4_9CAEN
MSEVEGHDKAGAACSGDEADDKGDRIPRGRGGSKPHSTPQTLKWLEENYEIAEGVCIPRSTLYYHYLDFCDANDTQPVNAASFGKIIRQQFPQITTRRLGTRGQSKYHYYGIGVKECSSYYDVIYSSKGVQSVGDGKKGETTKQMVAYSPRSKLGTLLPEFPDIKDIKIPPGVEEGKVLTFLMMYRTHCQRILDTVIRANFDEVQNFLLHFWQGMPPHIVPILDSSTIVMLVGVCDSILYRAIASVLMPTVLQALPDSLTQVIRRFAKQLDDWLKTALSSLPEGLQNIKFDLARRFAQVLRRQTSLNHLCQAARSVLQSPDITGQLLDDWLSVDLNSIVKQTLYTMDQYTARDHTLISNLCGEFERLLEEQAPIESFIEWLDGMVDKCVVKPSAKPSKSLRQIARQFLLMWSCFGTRVIRDMTLHSAPSFGSFHLLHLMFDDYVLYRIEALYSQERASDFLKIVRGEEVCGSPADELILPDPSAIKDGLVPLTSPGAYCGGQAGAVYQDRMSVITSSRHILPDAQGITEKCKGANEDTFDTTRAIRLSNGQRSGQLATQLWTKHYYDSQPEGYTTDESSSLDQAPSPRGMGAEMQRSSTLTPPAQLPSAGSVYNGSYVTSSYGTLSGGIVTPNQGYNMAAPSHTMLSGMETHGRQPLMMQNESRVTGGEWQISPHSRQQQQGMMGDTHPVARGNGTVSYDPYSGSRHSGYDVTNYQYDVNPGMNNGKTAGMHDAGYMYSGYGNMNDVYMTSGVGLESSKRRYEEDQSMRPFKRTNKDSFYFEPSFTSI